MTDDFDHSFAVVVNVEGGLVTDSGGLTKFGISQRAYPKVNIRDLTLADAKAIYLNDYWKSASCDSLPWPLSLFVFDSAVNQGVEKAVRTLQGALGVPQDGVLGRGSMAALNKLPLSETCALFMAGRALDYTRDREFPTDGKGWFKRLFVVAQSATK